MDDVTLILSRLEKGEASGQELLDVVYEELRMLARRKMAGERRGHTLQATALVHEAWLGLEGATQSHWKNRRHFFGAAAEAMRRILVDHARKRKAWKREGLEAGGEGGEEELEFAAPVSELLAVHEAIGDLEQEDPEAAELVKLRYFVGLTMQEAADAMGLKKRTAEGIWQFGRVWLKQRLR
jgi:RNA polymerase sigma factor (TIGR02999 family)